MNKNQIIDSVVNEYRESRAIVIQKDFLKNRSSEFKIPPNKIADYSLPDNVWGFFIWHNKELMQIWKGLVKKHNLSKKKNESKKWGKPHQWADAIRELRRKITSDIADKMFEDVERIGVGKWVSKKQMNTILDAKNKPKLALNVIDAIGLFGAIATIGTALKSFIGI